MMKDIKGNFRVWHIPRVGEDGIFRVACGSLEEAYRIHGTSNDALIDQCFFNGGFLRCIMIYLHVV